MHLNTSVSKSLLMVLIGCEVLTTEYSFGHKCTHEHDPLAPFNPSIKIIKVQASSIIDEILVFKHSLIWVWNFVVYTSAVYVVKWLQFNLIVKRAMLFLHELNSIFGIRYAWISVRNIVILEITRIYPFNGKWYSDAPIQIEQYTICYRSEFFIRGIQSIQKMGGHVFPVLFIPKILRVNTVLYWRKAIYSFTAQWLTYANKYWRGGNLVPNSSIPRTKWTRSHGKCKTATPQPWIIYTAIKFILWAGLFVVD